MNNYQKAVNIIEKLKERGIKAAEIDYALGYSKYYIANQLSKKVMPLELYKNLLEFYNDYLEHPDKYADLKNRAELYYKGVGEPFKRRSRLSEGIKNIEEPALAYTARSEMRLISEAMQAVAENSTTNRNILEVMMNTYANQLNDLVSSSKDVLSRLSALYLRGEANFGVVLQSLARLEEKPEASLVHEADKRYGDLWQQSQEQNKFDDGTSGT